MKNYEKKSFFTTLILFFIPLLILSSVVLYMYHNEQIQEVKKNILYQMKDYAYDFKGDTFSLDIVEDDKTKEIFTIYDFEGGLSAYFEVPSKGPYLLKVIYDKTKYDELHGKFVKKIFEVAVIIFFLILFISIGFAFYALKPMREAMNLLEDFLKDLIHDLNTPATAILLNTKLLRKRGNFEEIERIELCAKAIASLYKNLELMTPSSIINNETIFINQLIDERLEVLRKIYPHIVFVTNINESVIQSNQIALERILDNLLTNACKYNKKNGTVFIDIVENRIVIKDTGIGIQDTKKIFQRYYKENETGLGIGLSIVKKLCDILEISIDVTSVLNEGTTVELFFQKNL
ncbi:MAG: HAMP domain-containing sensor histidine kinase [Arcobacteraceae bacterium]